MKERIQMEEGGGIEIPEDLKLAAFDAKKQGIPLGVYIEKNINKEILDEKLELLKKSVYEVGEEKFINKMIDNTNIPEDTKKVIKNRELLKELMPYKDDKFYYNFTNIWYRTDEGKLGFGQTGIGGDQAFKDFDREGWEYLESRDFTDAESSLEYEIEKYLRGEKSLNEIETQWGLIPEWHLLEELNAKIKCLKDNGFELSTEGFDQFNKKVIEKPGELNNLNMYYGKD